METKKCSKCGEKKNLTEFYSRQGGKFGVRADCKACVIARNGEYSDAHKQERKTWQKTWRDTHRDEFRGMVYAWNAAHPEQAAANRVAWFAANPGKAQAASARWREVHPERVLAVASTRRAAKLNATPKWANEFFIDEIYALAVLRTELTGFQWHVDHIVPLKSKKVCGLHWEGNLQVVPAKVNQSKGNRHWPDMPVYPRVLRGSSVANELANE